MIDAEVVPQISDYLQEHQLPAGIMDNVKWDILNAIMEYNYQHEREPFFFMELLKVYESGNYPCGWKGSWLGGKLVVY
ncbi:hypothetical protein D3C77_629940 [compost metagenome]